MILLLFLFGLALGAETPSDEHEVQLQQENCPVFWFSFNGRCYKYIATRLTWADAELHCVSEGANLVSIHSLVEDDFVKSVIKNFDVAEGYTWLGLSDTQKEGGWMWSDGSAVNFKLWAPGEPNHAQENEDCVHNNVDNNKKWNDAPCSYTYPSVCAYRIDCPQQLMFMSNSTN
ncbi:lactose-binding lectin l-2-like [Seriola aureovittata]|uniref:lactose-binding lectin l-2-like n=1 Tax=Seriola aureovittata TaxID=2871759 RepID=UPI0024BE493E|nr:lactose-binding lectin l-2-like [Seriola aureovittata]